MKAVFLPMLMFDEREPIDVATSCGRERQVSSWRLTMLRIIAVIFVLLLLVGGCATTSHRLNIDMAPGHDGVQPLASHTTSF
jgi:hypothetical protein